MYEGENVLKPDIAAPGVRVTAPVPGGGYQSLAELLLLLLLDRERCAFDGVGNCQRKRSISLWRKSKSLFKKRRKAACGIRAMAECAAWVWSAVRAG